jgi:hypothetical protein
LNDVLMQRKKLLTKTYLGPDYVSVD